MNQTLEEFRLQIDEADRRLVQAFTDRMEISAGISRYKEAHNMKVYDPVREQKKLCQVELLAEESMREYVDSLYLLLFEIHLRAFITQPSDGAFQYLIASFV